MTSCIRVSLWPLLAGLLIGCVSLVEPASQSGGTDGLGPLDDSRHAALKCDVPEALDGNGQPVNSDAHILAINSRGYVVDLLNDGGEEPGPDTYRPNAVYEKTLAAILDEYKKFRDSNGDKPNRIVVYLNGGLNGECLVRKQAAEQVPLMRGDGIFPIFLAWSTGAFETYSEQVAHVRRGRYGDETLWLTAPIHVLSNIAEGIARLPTDILDQWTRYETSAFDIDEPTFALHGNYRWLKDNCDEPRCNVVFVDPDDNDYRLPNFIYFTSLAPLRGIATPFVSGIGRSAWRNMLRRSRVSVHWPDEFRTPVDCPGGGNDDWGCNRGYVAALLDKYPLGLGGFARLFYDFDLCLSDRVEAGKKCSERNLITADDLARLKGARITLIGHSMGTIVLNELLPVFPGLVASLDSIVYMASASRIRDTAHTLIPLLSENKAVKFYNLMLHPLADAREPVAFSAAPSGSLLEWIDEMYESPETVLDRTTGKWRNMRVAKHIFPAEIQGRMILKVFSPKRIPPERTKGKPVAWEDAPNPIRHGGFNDTDMRYWCPAFWGADRIDGICEAANP